MLIFCQPGPTGGAAVIESQSKCACYQGQITAPMVINWCHFTVLENHANFFYYSGGVSKTVQSTSSFLKPLLGSTSTTTSQVSPDFIRYPFCLWPCRSVKKTCSYGLGPLKSFPNLYAHTAKRPGPGGSPCSSKRHMSSLLRARVP